MVEKRIFEISVNLEYKTQEDALTKIVESSFAQGEFTVDLSNITFWQYFAYFDNDYNEVGLDHLPDVLFRYKNLKRLKASGNKISSVPSTIKELTSLEELNLANNSLYALPREIELLVHLRSLNVANNKLTVLPKEIENLRNLHSLDLSGNQIEALPPEILQLTNLHNLDLRGNPLSIPPEILEKTNEPKAILNYYFQIRTYIPEEKSGTGKDETRKATPDTIQLSKTTADSFAKPINETKLILVGQGSVGKTSILRQILHGTFDANQTKTEGISINQWIFAMSREVAARIRIQSFSAMESSQPLTVTHDTNIKLNIWDFGGQEIMHATHQFFLTKRSLYLLVLDARLTQEENRVEYWLKMIQSFGGDSPVLIVGNKIDQHPLDIDRTGLQKKYSNTVGILETSAATGAGIEALKAEIIKHAETLPHVRDLLPGTWFTIKSKLEEIREKKNFIAREEYINLCDTYRVHDEISQHTLIDFLHDLGVVLHFRDDPRLETLGILNPQWVTSGVYKILNSHELFQNQGKLTLPMLNNILTLPEYPKDKRLFIVDMMKKFELCYDIEPDKSFLIPDLLPKDEPFTGEWDNVLAFQVHYNILPSSILSRFIVRMNAFIHKTVWRSGVVLKYEGNTALVKADYEDRTIYIWVSGNEDTRRDLLVMIRGEFEAIHKTIAKIEVTEKIPVPNAPEAAPLDLTFLQKLASEGRPSLPVQVGSRIIDLIVKEVLNQVEKEDKSFQPNMVIQVQGNVYGAIGNSNKVNFVQKEFEPVYEAIADSSHDATEKQDLAAEVDEIRDEVAKGEQANESFLSRRFRNLKKMAPDIADVLLSALLGPGAATSTIVRKVAKKVKEDAK